MPATAGIGPASADACRRGNGGPRVQWAPERVPVLCGAVSAAFGYATMFVTAAVLMAALGSASSLSLRRRSAAGAG